MFPFSLVFFETFSDLVTNVTSRKQVSFQDLKNRLSVQVFNSFEESLSSIEMLIFVT